VTSGTHRVDLSVASERPLLALTAASPASHGGRAAWQVKLAVLALFLAVTGTTAGVAIGFNRPGPSHTITDAAAAAATTSSISTTSRTKEQAVQQYGVLALAANAHSTARIAAAANALQATLRPLVASAPHDPVALDAARQLLTGERAILVGHTNSGDDVLTALIAQTDGLLAQLPPINTAIAAPTVAPVSSPIDTTEPTAAPTDTPAAPTPTDSATQPADSATADDVGGLGNLVESPSSTDNP
jgi:hypothetical protein